MSLANITRPAVLAAIAEYDQLGEKKFLETYGFGRSRSYWLLYEGRRYASKAVAGVAHRYVDPAQSAIGAREFTGGEASVQRKLEALGFTVEVDESGHRTSSQLAVGGIYTRDDLRQLFGISDATINNGIFRPKGSASVWLFVTEEKTSDRTQYRDQLEGDTLHMQGQTAGRTDYLIMDHDALGMELLVFFRRSRQELPGAGFRFLGPFEYVSHTGLRPASFVLKRTDDKVLSAEDAAPEDFDPSSVADGRKRIMRSIAERRGQKAFRDALRAAYGDRCAISGCNVLDVLEAAHISPYRGPETNSVANGLLLRTDLHTLFDCGLIAIANSE